jgi:hypothetical protein
MNVDIEAIEVGTEASLRLEEVPNGGIPHRER